MHQDLHLHQALKLHELELQQVLKLQELQLQLAHKLEHQALKLQHQGSNLPEWQEALILREAHLLGEELEEDQGDELE